MVAIGPFAMNAKNEVTPVIWCLNLWEGALNVRKKMDSKLFPI